jgi:Ni/Fe-hydrogenase subunit HybB-like protein
MKRLFYILWAIAFILGVIGVYLRLTTGHELANYGNRVVWGLWVAMYIYFIGLSAGAFLLSSLVYVFRVKIFEEIGRLALVTALTTLVCALLSIWFDLGHMGRAYEVITRPNLPSSMMAWMIWLYSAYFILLILETFFAFNIESGKIHGEELKSMEKKLRILATLGIPLAIAFHGGVGALFGVVASNPMWHSALTPIFFLVGAIASGSALLTSIFAFFWGNKSGEVYNKIIPILAKITLVAVMFDLLLEWAELSISLWLGSPSHTAGFRDLLWGDYWYVFWIIHILFGVVIPIFILAKYPTNGKAVAWSTALVALTFLGVRLNIVIPGLTHEKIHGEAAAYLQERLSFHYFPSIMEWLVALFIFSLGVAIFYTATKKYDLLVRHVNKPHLN